MRTRKPTIPRPDWPKYQRLIYQWAHHYARECPAARLDDLIAEGSLAFCEAIETWDPTRGAFSTHLVWQLRHYMGRWIKREVRFMRNVGREAERLGALIPTEAEETVEIPEEQGWLSRLMEHLGDEAQTLVRLALEGVELPLRQRHATREVRQGLRALRYA